MIQWHQRRIILFCILVGAAAWALHVIFVSTSNINAGNYARIRLGMPLAEAERILGASTDTSPTGELESIHWESIDGTAIRGTERFWRNQSYWIVLTTSPAGKIVAKSFSRPKVYSVLEYVRAYPGTPEDFLPIQDAP